MKIKNRLSLIFSLFFLLFIIISITIYQANVKIFSASEEFVIATKINRHLNELSAITYENLLYHENRMQAQWQLSYNSALKLSKSGEAVFNTAKSREISKSISTLLASVKELFTHLNTIPEKRRELVGEGDSDEKLAVLSSLEARLTSQMLLKSYGSILNSLSLQNIAKDEIRETQGKADLLIVSTLFLFTIVLASALFLTNRSIVTPLLRLVKGTEEIGSGNLDYKVDTGAKDETGELARHFDAMRLKLKASHDHLEELVEERTMNLKHRTDELEYVNKELEAFSYSVSHDLRAPLRSIDGFSKVLLEDYAGKLDDEGKDSLNRVRKASQRMGQLIDDILKISRVSRADIKHDKVDLTLFAKTIATELQKTEAERKSEFVIQEGLVVEGDPGLLRVLMENLLGNAWKFTGNIEHAKIEFGSQQVNGRSIYFVQDNGVGFDMSYVDKLFMPFQRLHSEKEFPGTGIGLATVQRIISRCGGHIRAESEINKGATFYFSL